MSDFQPPDSTTYVLAEGQAALFLVEGLLFALLDAKLISTEKLQEAIELVIATKRNLAADGQRPAISQVSAGILSAMANSIAAASEPEEASADTAKSGSAIT